MDRLHMLTKERIPLRSITQRQREAKIKNAKRRQAAQRRRREARRLDYMNFRDFLEDQNLILIPKVRQ